jgi:hypothetical protein
MRKTIQMLGTLAIAAALTMTMASCSSDKETVENPAQPTQPTQPTTSGVTVTVGAGMATDGATTRSAVANDNGDRVLKFTEGDKLYVYGANNDVSIAGELTMVANSLSNDGLSAQFTGTLRAYDLSSGNEKTNYSWGEDPLFGTTATLIHKDINTDAISYTVGNSVTVNYNMYADDVETLMKTSLKVQGDYASGTGYTLSSSDPILNCTISGLTASTEYTFTLKKGNTSANNVTITTGADGTASFAFASMESGSATWSIETKQGNNNVGTISLGSQDFTAKVYSITRLWMNGAFHKLYTCNSSDWSSKISAFNAETSANPILQLSSDITVITETFIISRSNGIIDLNGHILGKIYLTNNTLNQSITLKNGTVRGDSRYDNAIDGVGGWTDFYYGTVILEDLTVQQGIYTDGHEYIIRSGNYQTIYHGKSGSCPGKLVIYGGYFNKTIEGPLQGAAVRGTYELYGGKYAVRPNDSWCASGYSVKSNTDSDSGTYPWIVSAN